MKNALIIYNAISRKSYFHTNITSLVDELIKEGYKVEIYATQASKDSIKKIKKSKKIDLVVCAGGDGTINEVVTAISRYNKDMEVLYFPTGTVNDFAYTLGIKNNYKSVIKLLKEKKVNKVDTGMINDMYFNYVAAIGHFTSASYETHQGAKNHLGANAYILNGLANFRKEDSEFKIAMDVDGELISGVFKYCLLVNSKSVAGHRNLFPINEINDGKFVLVAIKKNHGLSAIELSNVFINGITRLDQLSENLAVVREFKNLKIKIDRPIKWTVDGEEGPVGDINVSVIKQNIKIYSDIGEK